MAQDILIKRSSSTAAPSTLENGELAYSSNSNKLFIGRPGGTTGDVDAIGGKAFTDKLDGIEANATADQTAAEIKTAYESNADTNAYTDSEKTKLTGVETNATADQTASEIKSLYESNANTNAFTDADESKLDGIEASATADQTAAEIRTLVESATDSNVFTDADHTKLNGVETSANNYELSDLNTHLAAGVGNIVTTGYLRGPATFTIDPAAHGDNTGEVVIAGDLTVEGTTTTIDSNTISLGDNLIVFNGDLPAGSAPTETAGFTVNRGSATDVNLHWNETTDKWTVSDASGVSPYNYPILHTKNFEDEITELDGGTF